MRTLLTALSAALVMVLSPLALPASYAGDYPTSPEGDPPGANDWGCRPTASRPTPVILVHGTFGDRKHLLERLSQAIKDEGFCVFSLDYGNRGTEDIADSARELKRYTNRVLEATGASRVSMVGHSQGGMMPRYYLKFLGGTAVVDDLVGMAPSNHGTSISQGDHAECRACEQQAAGSRFLQRLNAGDETPGQVSYTQLTTRYDQVVVPHTSGHLAEGPRTTNLTLQDVCPPDTSDHLLIATSTATIAIALEALTRDGPAREGPRVACF